MYGKFSSLPIRVHMHHTAYNNTTGNFFLFRWSSCIANNVTLHSGTHPPRQQSELRQFLRPWIVSSGQALQLKAGVELLHVAVSKSLDDTSHPLASLAGTHPETL